MRVILTDDVADGRRLFVRAVPGVAEVLHGVEGASVHRLEPVSDVRQRSTYDHRHRIFEIGLPHLVFDGDHAGTPVIAAVALIRCGGRVELAAIALRDGLLVVVFGDVVAHRILHKLEIPSRISRSKVKGFRARESARARALTQRRSMLRALAGCSKSPHETDKGALMALDEHVVRDALKTVNDPGIGKDLVTLNMVGEVQVEGAFVRAVINLTTPACPLKGKIQGDIEQALTGSEPSAWRSSGVFRWPGSAMSSRAWSQGSSM